jgi:molybdopterin converting factor small subunit
MTVSVLLFASYADLLGRSTIDVTVEPGATVADVLSAVRKLASGDRLPATPLVAVNEVYATPEQTVVAGDEVAIIPPVAGG